MNITTRKKRVIDTGRLRKVKTGESGRIVAQCPVCALGGSDKTGNHLVVYPDGRFGCVANPGPEGKEHRRAILKEVGREDDGKTRKRVTTFKALGWAR